MQTGTQFGRYTIERKLGEGGMGEVYLATDNSLERFVALKILSNEFTQDADRIQRLKQEAKAASALNHPNIITIYEIGSFDSVEFIAMEFVEGKTLRGVIAETELSLADSLGIAEQIADGLSIAHKVRIAHRDVKPENVMLREDGYVRILDFGLAKLTNVAKRRTEDETLEMIKTAPGVVMGSVSYMSPEQARGKAIDERSDIWSLGAVLYEMISGRPPFDGETVSDTLANLIHVDPESLSKRNTDLPKELDRILQKSLAKNREHRYQSAQDLAADLKALRRNIEVHETEGSRKFTSPAGSKANLLSDESRTQIYLTDESKLIQTDEDLTKTKAIGERLYDLPDAPKGSRQVFSTVLFTILGVVLVVILGITGFKFLTDRSTSSSSAFQDPQISRMSDDGKSRLPAISPDGKYIAFQSGDLGARNIMVRQLATGSAVEIVPKSALALLSITFSPDGDYVYYVQANSGTNANSLYQVPTLGKTSKKILDDIDSKISFGDGGKRFVFIRHSETNGNDTLIAANSDGTQEKPIIASNQTEYGFLGEPNWSPDSSTILLKAGTNNGGETETTTIVETSLDGRLRPLTNNIWKGISDIQWRNDGKGYFALANEKDGEPKQVWTITYPAGERRRITNDTNSYVWLGVSGDDNTLITVKSDASSSLWSFSTLSKELKQLTPEDRNANGDSGLIATQNGNLIVTRYKDSELDLWEVTPEGKDVRQLTSRSRFNAEPKVSSDGTKICFMSNRSNLWRVWLMDIDGQNPRQVTVVSDEVNQFGPNFINGGKRILFAQREKNSGLSRLKVVPIEGGVPIAVVVPGIENASGVYGSPDGRQLAVLTSDSNYRKYLQVFALTGDMPENPKRKFDPGIMEAIKWSPDLKTLSYLNNEGVPNVWQVSLDG